MSNAETQRYPTLLFQAGVMGGAIVSTVIHTVQGNIAAGAFDVLVGIGSGLATREGREIAKDIITGKAFINLLKPKIQT